MSSVARTVVTNAKMDKFLRAMKSVYGQFDSIPQNEVDSWVPPETAEGHQGRYLWTDGFAVCNFITLHQQTSDPKYLTLASRLITTVHNTLGHTRDLSSRLPNATDSYPLRGGLRIGKHEDEDSSSGNGDGQYFHYLTVWMFALNRMTIASGKSWYNEQAISLAESVLPKFMINWEDDRPRMFWKMSTDLSRPLVMSEGNLDPIDGYVTYKLLQKTSGDAKTLEKEIQVLKKVVDKKWKDYHSTDPLDLGMTLWTVHWLRDEEEWAREVSEKALTCVSKLVRSRYFDRAISGRLGFREFGTALGIQCYRDIDQTRESLSNLPDQICETWEHAGQVPEPAKVHAGKMAALMPITAVMYATAVNSGCFIS